MRFPTTWDLLTRIDHLQRKIIVASIQYYEMDSPCISDAQYDDLVKQLKAYMRECDNIEQSRYWYVFREWDGSTGYFLYYNLTTNDKQYLYDFAHNVAKAYEKRR